MDDPRGTSIITQGAGDVTVLGETAGPVYVILCGYCEKDVAESGTGWFYARDTNSRLEYEDPVPFCSSDCHLDYLMIKPHTDIIKEWGELRTQILKNQKDRW